jgi:IS30 family transposase
VPGVRLGVEERIAIRIGLVRGDSLAQIGRRLGRPTSTISREVARNGGRDAYRPASAQAACRERAARPKQRKLIGCPRLAAAVSDGLTKRWSPAAIAARLRVDHTDDAEMRVSHETIYRSLYLQGRGGLKRELIAALRSGRLRRRTRKRGENARRGNVLGAITPISARPAEAADRAVPGHWEGDLIMGAFNRTAIVTLVERTSRFLILGELPAGHDAQAVYECLTDLIGDLPELMRQSLTWDQGREMARWPRLQIDADVDVFFCDPHSPWQRPSNENTNGLLRQYFPKGTDLNLISRPHLHQVAAQHNDRPRKVLEYGKPIEVYSSLVAATG